MSNAFFYPINSTASKNLFAPTIEKYEKLLSTKSEVFWQKEGEKRALKLFHLAANKVPAYKNFLKKNKINSAKINNSSDFARVPFTSKENYIQNYSLAERCWGGKLDTLKLIASSSGTTGTPNYWPRSILQEQEAVLTHELLFKNLFSVDRYTTLVIIGFPMGVYVSGAATLLPVFQLSKNYNLSIVSCGNNKTEVIKAVKALGKNFEQILLIGHPFFLKDTLETGKSQGINWKSHKVNLMFCSEGFSEEWREYILKKANIKNARAFNTYGSSEMLLMAYETESSVAAKKLMEQNTNLAHNIAGTKEFFNFFQYNPVHRYIEQAENELLFTSNSGIPLVRFNLHDKGRIVNHKKLSQTLDLPQPKWNLPYVALFGRSDHAVILYAANIYPPHIQKCLNKKEFLGKITGKFAMLKGYFKNLDEYLEINIELRAGVSVGKDFGRVLKNKIFNTLLQTNSEYLDAYKKFGKKVIPFIKIWPYGHDKYFKAGLKPRYIVK